ncbi:MAG: nitrate reductase associated protein [Elainellaceae cyanobacterium]
MTFFQFEADFTQSLRCIPMQVRYNLDTCGVKLKLVHWNSFTAQERQQLVDLPCDSPQAAAAYRDYVQGRVVAHTGSAAGTLPIDPTPPWRSEGEIPASVAQKLEETQQQLSLAHWAALSPLQRFALIKLSRPSHENRNFEPAVKEFLEPLAGRSTSAPR